MEVWTTFHRAHRIGGDVAIASSRSDDTREWERAHYESLRNMRSCYREARRWEKIADEMADGLTKVHQAEHNAVIARLEGRDVG
jgi:hypothetical protein